MFFRHIHRHYRSKVTKTLKATVISINQSLCPPKFSMTCFFSHFRFSHSHTVNFLYTLLFLPVPPVYPLFLRYSYTTFSSPYTSLHFLSPRLTTNFAPLKFKIPP